jgi:hypothetical protein
VWATAIHGPSNEYAQSAAVLDEEVVISGWYAGTAIAGGQMLPTADGVDQFLVRASLTDGSVVAVRGLTADSPGEIGALADTVLLTGGYVGTLDLGVGVLTNSGASQDIYVARIHP